MSEATRAATLQFGYIAGVLVYAEVPGFIDFSFDAFDSEMIDVSHLDLTTSSGYREFVPGTKPTASGTVTLNWDPDHWIHQALWTKAQSNALNWFRLDTDTMTFVFQAHVAGLSLTGDASSQVIAEVSLRVNHDVNLLPVP